jgi:hypothetical protein
MDKPLSFAARVLDSLAYSAISAWQQLEKRKLVMAKTEDNSNCQRGFEPIRSHGDSTRTEFFSIPELAIRWRCSRGTVYNRLRDVGAQVVDFAPLGKRGKKIVPARVVFKIETSKLKRL